MLRKLSSKITISPASLATSVPLPMAKPTSARLRAGASLTPSPVIPTTKFFSWANLTNRSLSSGKALATTLSLLKFSFISPSLIAASSADVHTSSFSETNKPASRAMAMAVSFLSPVIITTCTPACCTCAIASTASGRTSSRIATTPTRVKPFSRSSCPSSPPSKVHKASRRMACLACCCSQKLCCSRSVSDIVKGNPSSDQ